MHGRTFNPAAIFVAVPQRFLVVAIVATSAYAQDPILEANDPEPFVQELQSGPNLIYKDPETGNVSVIPGFTKKMLQDALERAQLQQTARLFDFVELNISGEELADGFAYLTVDLRIDVHVDAERVSVPVGFNDFRLRDRIEHRCESPASWAKLDTEKLPAKNWIIFGKGQHRLTFDLIGQIRTTANGQQRIRINGPVAPLSNLQMTFHDVVETAQLANGNPVVLRSDSDNGNSGLQTWGLAEQTEIIWTPKPSDEMERVAIRATAAARMKMDLTTDPGSLVVNQPLAISGGSLDRLEVRLPQKFTQVSITGTDADGNSIIRSLQETEEDAWLILFSDPITGPITLNYDLGLGKESYPQDISVVLPDITNAANETGDIELLVPIGLDVQATETSARRIRVTTSAGPRTAVVAYRLLSTDSRLDLTVSETPAIYSVVPHISFETERDENTLLLTARFKVNILRGSLNRMSLSWPNFANDDWQVVTGDTRLKTESDSIPIGLSPDEGSDTFSVLFPERQSGQFEIEMQAFRDLKSIQAVDGILFLPDIVSPTPHPSKVSVVESDADSISLNRIGEQSSFPVLPTSRWPEALRESEQTVSAWLVNSPSDPVQIRISPQKPEVRANALVALSVAGESIAINQIISYDVRHDDLSEIRLALPDVTCRVRLNDLPPQQLTRLSSASGQSTYSLPESRRGRFQIAVDYFWTPKAAKIDSGTQKLEIPIALPLQSESGVENLTVATNDPRSLLLATSDVWERIHTESYPAAWRSIDAQSAIPVMVRHSLHKVQNDGPKFVVINSAVVGQQLITSITGLYDRHHDSALFTVDPDSELINASVNGTMVSPDRLSSPADGRNLVQVRTNQNSESSHPTTVTLVVQQPFDRQHHLFSVCHPDLPQPAGEAGDCNTVWILSQTADQSVFGVGHDVTFLGGSLFARLSGRNRESSRMAINSVLAPYDSAMQSRVLSLFDKATQSSERFDVMAGTVFARSQTLVIISRRVIFLITAILSLLTYFTCLRLRPFHLFVAFGALAVATALAVSATPITVHVLLLQLIPGIGIAGTAAAVQRCFLNRRETPFRTVNSSDANTIFSIEKPEPIAKSSTLSIGKT